MRRLIVLAALVVGLALPSAAFASALDGHVTGVISGANAYVYIHNDTTGANGSTQADGSGNYHFSGLVPGYQYDVYATKISGCFQYYSAVVFFYAQIGGNNVPLNMDQSERWC